MADWWDQYPEAKPIDVALQAEGITGEVADIARSIYEQESGSGRNTKTSNAGAVGGMQVIPATFKRMADEGWDIKDPVHNARAGIRYVQALYDRADGDPVLTAAGYYGGEGGQDKARKGEAVRDPRNPKAPSTLEYARQVAARLPKKEAAAAWWEQYPEVESDSTNPATKQAVPIPEKKRAVTDDLARQVGLTVRAGAKGLASLPGMVVDAVTGPINAAADAIGGPGTGRIPTTVNAVDSLLTKAGLPVPETSAERVVQDASAAMAGGGGFAATGQMLAKSAGPIVSAVGKGLAAGPGLQVTSGAAGGGASGIVREEGGGAGAQVAAGLGAALAPGLGKAGIQDAGRRVLRGGEVGRATMETNLAAFETAGTQPSLGQATGGRWQQALEAGASKVPGGAGVMERFSQRQAAQMDEAIQRISTALAPNSSATDAGEAIVRGVDTFKANIKATQKQLYAKLDAHIAPDTPISVSNAEGSLKALTADIPGAETLSGMFKNNRIQGISQALQADLDNAVVTGTLPYRAVKELRSAVGREMADGGLVPDVPRAQWSKLYGALSDDLGEAANGAGPQAARAWEVANRYTRAQMEKLERLSGIVSKDAPEKIFQATISGTSEGATVARRVINALPMAERREVAAAVLQRLGRATPGQQNAIGDAFSSETFLTNLSRMSPIARHTLFGRTNIPEIEQQVASLATVAAARRNGSKVFSNPSGTAPALAQMAIASGMGGGFAHLAATGNPVPFIAALAPPVGSWMAAKGSTSPAISRFAAEKSSFQIGMPAAAVGAAARMQGQSQAAPEAGVWDQYPEVQQPSMPAPRVENMPTVPVVPQMRRPVVMDNQNGSEPDGSNTLDNAASLPGGDGSWGDDGGGIEPVRDGMAGGADGRVSSSAGSDGSAPEAVVLDASGEHATPVTTVTQAGTLTIRGNPDVIIALLTKAGIRSILPAKNGVIVGRSEAAKAQAIIADFQHAPEPVYAQAPLGTYAGIDATDQLAQYAPAGIPDGAAIRPEV